MSIPIRFRGDHIVERAINIQSEWERFEKNSETVKKIAAIMLCQLRTYSIAPKWSSKYRGREWQLVYEKDLHTRRRLTTIDFPDECMGLLAQRFHFPWEWGGSFANPIDELLILSSDSCLYETSKLLTNKDLEPILGPVGKPSAYASEKMIKKAKDDLRKRYHSFPTGKNLPDFVPHRSRNRDEREEVERLWISIFGNLDNFVEKKYFDPYDFPSDYFDVYREQFENLKIQDQVVKPGE